jgi:hypothetical protein
MHAPRTVIPLDEFLIRVSKSSPRMRNASSDSPRPIPNWDNSLDTQPNHSLPDTLQLLALHRPDLLRFVERIARACADTIDRDLRDNSQGS